MNVPLWVHETAAFFWEAAGTIEPFPRTLRDPLRRCPFDVTVKELSGLSTTVAEQYLTRCGPGWACPGADRAVRACLAARDGAGFILLDADDPEAERTFSLAHELAHFLWHYWHPRRASSRRLGPGVTAVFDGKRPPTTTERVGALLAGVPLGPHLHLMERGPKRCMPSAAVATVEDEADRLGRELLAPAALVLQRARRRTTGAARLEAERQLETAFGLPRSEAAAYACRLYPLADPLLRRLGISS